jgi:hypothetical protein
MNILIWPFFVFAIVVSFVVWVANLKVASSTTDPVVGVNLLLASWGAFLLLLFVKLMTMGSH